MGKKKKQKRKQAKAIKIKYAIKAKEAKKVIEQEKELFPHFRRHKPSKHPALILGENEVNDNEYDYRKVTHSEEEGRHLNEKIDPNPNAKDTDPMYIVKRKRHDIKTNFSNKLPWNLPKK